MRIHLDLSTVEAFVVVADLRSFTQAADALGVTQACVSMKLRRLETVLDRCLINRTPRQVKLSADGDAFLPRARTLLAAQDIALTPPDMPARKLILGISDHVAGPELPGILAKVSAFDPGLAIKVRVGASRDLIDEFALGKVDVAIIRRQKRRRDDLTLFHDGYGWFGALTSLQSCSPLPLVTVDDACGVRSIAIRLLSKSKIDWVDTFIGGGVATALAAVTSGIGIAPLPRRLATVGVMEVGEQFGLPPLPKAAVTMLAHPVDAQTKATLRVFVAAFRGSVDSTGS